MPLGCSTSNPTSQGFVGSRRDSPQIAEDTCGTIFLSTSHQGSSISFAGATVSFLTGFLGSNTTLLLTLRSQEKYLSDLEGEFRDRHHRHGSFRAQ